MKTYESIPEIIASYPERFKPEKAKGTDAVIQLNITGEGGERFYMVIQSGTLDIERGTHPDPTMAVTAEADDWIALNNGDTTAMTLLMRGKIKFSGSLPMAMKFRSMFETAS